MFDLRLAVGVSVPVVAEPRARGPVLAHPFYGFATLCRSTERPCAASAGAVGDRKRDAFVVAPGPKSRLAAAAVPYHRYALGVKSWLRLDPVYDTRESPSPFRYGAPAVRLAKAAVERMHSVRSDAVRHVQGDVVQVEAYVCIAARHYRVRRNAGEGIRPGAARVGIEMVAEHEDRRGIVRARAFGQRNVDVYAHLAARHLHVVRTYHLVRRTLHRLSAEPVPGEPV